MRVAGQKWGNNTFGLPHASFAIALGCASALSGNSAAEAENASFDPMEAAGSAPTEASGSAPTEAALHIEDRVLLEEIRKLLVACSRTSKRGTVSKLFELRERLLLWLQKSSAIASRSRAFGESCWRYLLPLVCDAQEHRAGATLLTSAFLAEPSSWGRSENWNLKKYWGFLRWSRRQDLDRHSPFEGDVCLAETENFMFSLTLLMTRVNDMKSAEDRLASFRKMAPDVFYIGRYLGFSEELITRWLQLLRLAVVGSCSLAADDFERPDTSRLRWYQRFLEFLERRVSTGRLQCEAPDLFQRGQSCRYEKPLRRFAETLRTFYTGDELRRLELLPTLRDQITSILTWPTRTISDEVLSHILYVSALALWKRVKIQRSVKPFCNDQF